MDDRSAIIDTIIRFANGFDLKDWQMLRDCFTETILVDYSDLRGEPPSTVLADDYVAQRKIALTPLMTQHLSSNHVVRIAGTGASCQSQMIIFRRKEDKYFNTHCFYEHTLTKIKTAWKIDTIKQKVWRSEGDPSIHAGAK